MGFCRRCGDIVVGTRCKCGGTAVAPVLQWSSTSCHTVDKWSQTYVSKDSSPARAPIQIDSAVSLPSNVALTGSSSEPDQCTLHTATTRRPSSSRLSSPSVSGRITSQLGTTTSPVSLSNRSSTVDERSPPSPPTSEVDASIFQAPNAPELSKAFGSILQPKESLAPYSCAICLTEFQPDATIFPDPSSRESFVRFLCRPCFIISGGSKGDCPVCRRPVLILKTEGGFVEASGRVWHKKCFSCEGCHRNIGNTPMVDLLGQPSCADCFDSCLKRNSTPKRPHLHPSPEKVDHRTSTTFIKDLRSREGSPAIDELEQRLGIMKNREGSPVFEELTQRLNAVLNRASPSASPLNKDRDGSPLAHRVSERKKSATFVNSHSADFVDILASGGSFGETGTTTARQELCTGNAHGSSIPFMSRPSLDAIEEMKSRFMNQVTSPASSPDPTSSPVLLSNTTITNSPTPTPSRIPRISRVGGSPQLRHALSSSSLRSSRMSWTPSTPDLISDSSDTLTQSSGPSSPQTFSPQTHPRDEFNDHLGHSTTRDVDLEHTASGMVTPKRRDSFSKSSIPTAVLSSGSLCAKCGGSLFATGGSGRFVTVPERTAGGPPKTYHTECFRCALCDGPFRETANGQAVFVRGEGGACHIECAPTGKTQAKSTANPSFVKSTPPDPSLSPPLVSLTNTLQTTPKSCAGTSRSEPPQNLSHHSNINSVYSSSRYERSPSTPSVSSSSSRFGSSAVCPGCQKVVSPMEMGVVPGPQGSRWHAACLICGGKGTGKGRRDRSQPGCGKRLDSAAKRDTQGGVWCRECLLLLPLQMRNPQVGSSSRPLVPSHTGRSAGGGSSIAPQLTGTTTIARQFTGRGGGDSGIMRQLTGGGPGSVRQLSGSPTKQLGLVTPRPRPKSVIGMRSSKSIDEGRGMYLVRQMTGGGGSFGI